MQRTALVGGSGISLSRVTVSALPEPVARVSAYLAAAGAEARIEQIAATCHSAQEAADAIGCALGQIVKSIALVCDTSSVVALLPGDLRADVDRIARLVGASKGRIATAVEVERITGFVPGTVAPFPLAAVHHILVERRLLQQRVVWAGAGSDRHMVALAPRELLRLSRARPAPIGR